MITNFADTRTASGNKFDRIARAQAEACVRATATPVFADISRFAEPSATRMVWVPTTSGHHPSFV